jgi:hypothetical protein
MSKAFVLVSVLGLPIFIAAASSARPRSIWFSAFFKVAVCGHQPSRLVQRQRSCKNVDKVKC